MGKTRRRVTFLVLSLESIGLMVLVAAAYWAGEVRLECTRRGSTVACIAEEKRCLGLWTVQRRRIPGVRDAVVGSPAVGRSDHWLSLEAEEGTVRVLAGGEGRTRADVERLRQFLADGGQDGVQVHMRRSSRLLALVAAFFGCFWLLVISLIMREFLGFHTPWWWRAIRRR